MDGTVGHNSQKTTEMSPLQFRPIELLASSKSRSREVSGVTISCHLSSGDDERSQASATAGHIPAKFEQGFRAYEDENLIGHSL
jgi:hypothetical protein